MDIGRSPILYLKRKGLVATLSGPNPLIKPDSWKIHRLRAAVHPELPKPTAQLQDLGPDGGTTRAWER